MRQKIPRFRVRPGDVTRLVREQRVRSLVLDVEPFICLWGTDDEALTTGLSTMLATATEIETLTHVALLTNSRRVPSVLPLDGRLAVTYRVRARKPWLKLAELRSLPRPFVVVGDQPLTDGLVAWRLDAPFFQLVLPDEARLPVRLQARLGGLLAPIFFSREPLSS